MFWYDEIPNLTKNINAYIRYKIKIIIVITIMQNSRHSFHLLSSVRILSTPFAVSVYTLHSLIPLSFSYSFLSVDNWWLSFCYGYSLKMSESQIAVSNIGNSAFLWRGENRDIRCPDPNFWAIQETMIAPRKSGRMGFLSIWRRVKKMKTIDINFLPAPGQVALCGHICG